MDNNDHRDPASPLAETNLPEGGSPPPAVDTDLNAPGLDAANAPAAEPDWSVTEAPSPQPAVDDELTICWENNEDRPCTSQVGIVTAQHEDGTVDVLLSDGVVLERVGVQAPGVSPYYA